MPGCQSTLFIFLKHQHRLPAIGRAFFMGARTTRGRVNGGTIGRAFHVCVFMSVSSCPWLHTRGFKPIVYIGGGKSAHHTVLRFLFRETVHATTNPHQSPACSFLTAFFRREEHLEEHRYPLITRKRKTQRNPLQCVMGLNFTCRGKHD